MQTSDSKHISLTSEDSSKNEQTLQKTNSDKLMWVSHEYLTNIFDDDFLNNIPTIETTLGSTGYLDRIEPKDFCNNKGLPVCIIKGFDEFKRHFVSFGTKIINNQTNEIIEQSIYTLFPRYTDPNSSWVMCRSHYSDSLGYIFRNVFEYSVQVNNKALNHLKNLINNYKQANNGIVLSYEIYNDISNEYDKIPCTVKLYCPLNKN